MPPPLSQRFRGPPLFAIALGLGALLSQLGGAEAQDALRWERDAVLAGQWWRLLSAHLVHGGWMHLAMNLAALAVLVLLAPKLRVSETLAGSALAALAIALGLLWFTRIDWYVGLSGVLHGWAVLAGGALLRERQRLGGVLLAGLALKLAWEMLAEGGETEALIGMAVVTEAHLMGALGALPVALFGLWRAFPISRRSARSDRQ